MKQLLGVVVVVVVLFGVFAAWLLGTAWYRLPGLPPRPAPAAAGRILAAAEYEALIETHARPFVFEITAPGGGSVLVFGAEHTMRPDDPQLETLRQRWRAMRPTVALVESDLGMMFPAFMDPVRTFGEPGLVHALAREDGIPTWTWEPPTEAVIQAVLDQGFSPEQVALRWTLNPYFSNLRHGRQADPDAFVRDTLAERSRIPGIAGVLTSMEDVNDAWRRAFPDGPDWRDVSDQYGLPGFLAAMDLNQPRDVHLVACVEDFVRSGERVFVVCGSSHAVRIEPALAALAG